MGSITTKARTTITSGTLLRLYAPSRWRIGRRASAKSRERTSVVPLETSPTTSSPAAAGCEAASLGALAGVGGRRAIGIVSRLQRPTTA